MPTYTVQIDLDAATRAVLLVYARSRKQTLPEALAALLYRQAAQMSGWPGQAGAELERAWLNTVLPADDDLAEEV